MPSFSKSSLEKLATCHEDLQKLFNEVIKDVDCVIVCGFRNQEDQDKAFADGFSKLKWPHGKHNREPSHAVDVCPFPIEWDNVQRFEAFAEVVKCKAEELKINVTWGGSWKDFPDRPHWELKGVA